jgi:hypothetical protein
MATYDELLSRTDVNGKHNVTVSEVMESKDDLTNSLGWDMRPETLLALFGHGNGGYAGRYMVCDSTDVDMYQNSERFALREAAEAYAKLSRRDCLDTHTKVWII